MTKPYSEDLRTRVVSAVVAGASCRDAAQRFSIGVSSVVRWAQRFRRTGSVAAKPMGGKRNSRLKDERDWLLARVAASPDLPLHDIRRELAARNVRVGYGTIWRFFAFFAKEKITFKKIVRAAEQDRPDIAAERMRWQEDQKQLDPKCLVFIDDLGKDQHGAHAWPVPARPKALCQSAAWPLEDDDFRGRASP